MKEKDGYIIDNRPIKFSEKVLNMTEEEIEREYKRIMENNQ